MEKKTHRLRKIGSVFLGLIILVYIVYQAFIINYSFIKTETAIYSTITESIDVTAWFVREEEVVTSTAAGMLSFNVDNGERITVGGVLGTIYNDSETAVALTMIENIEDDIVDLETLINSIGTSTITLDSINGQINESVSEIAYDLAQEDFEDLYSARDSILYLLNQKSLLFEGEDKSIYQARIYELESEKSLLELSLSSESSYIYSEYTGYYISQVDGYEHYFDIENITDIEVSDIESATASQVSTYAIGKIATDFEWYIVAVIDQDDKIKLGNNTSVEIKVDGVPAESISATVESINYDEESGNYALVLSSTYTCAEVLSIREQNIEIVISEYSGALISQDAIHFETVTDDVEDEDGNVTQVVYENVMGVYVNYGSRIRFVQIFPLAYNSNGYVICNINLSDSEEEVLYTSRSINLYDEVVIEGNDLYDGKIV